MRRVGNREALLGSKLCPKRPTILWRRSRSHQLSLLGLASKTDKHAYGARVRVGGRGEIGSIHDLGSSGEERETMLVALQL